MDVIERKKSLRILAGIFLLVGMVIGLGITVFSYLSSARNSMTPGFFRLYWPTLVQDLILVLIVIFIFRRLFIADGILEGVVVVLALVNLASAVFSLVKGAPRDLTSYYAGLAVTDLFVVAADVLLMIGFFLHRRASKKLFVVAAILQLLTSLAISVLPSVMLGSGYARAAAILSTLGAALFVGSFTFLGWLFMGLYFGAQKEAPDAVQPSFE